MKTEQINSNPSEIFLRDSQLSKRYSVSRATIWRWTRDGQLPKPVSFGPGCTRWRLSELEQFEADAGRAS